jgi:hypothetical protein
MRCGRCGADNADQARFCMSCGSPFGKDSFGAGDPTTNIDFRRLGPGDLLAGGATVLLFVSLFLPWYRYGFLGSSVTVSAMGAGAGGWRVMILILCVVIVAYLFVRAIWELPGLPVPHWQVLAAATILNALLTIIAFLVKPGGGVTGLIGADVGWSWGAYVGLAVALLAVAGGFQYSFVIGDAAAIFFQDVGQGHQPSVASAVRRARPPAATPIVRVCSNCGASLESGNQFCIVCGTPISPSPDQ